MRHRQAWRRRGVLTKGARVFLTVVLGIAFTGYLVGLRQSRRASQTNPRPPVLVPQANAELKGDVAKTPAALRYAELPGHKQGPNSDWISVLSKLGQPPVSPPPKSPATKEERDTLLLARAARRAFDGAPPLIPHPTTQLSTASCLACHEKGLVIGDKVASKMSHPLYANCTQCHVEAPSGESPAPLAASPGVGRAFQGAPVPLRHAVWMRENCLSCHGPTGPGALRTTHPDRLNCLQCHVPSHTLDTAPIAWHFPTKEAP